MKRLKILMFVIIGALAFSSTVFANSAPDPLPRLVVTLRNASPKVVIYGININSTGEKTEIKAQYREFNGMKYHVFDHNQLRPSYLRVEHGSDSFAVEIPDRTTDGYEDYVTLDYKSRIVSPGEPTVRSHVFTLLRVLSTLIIEGAVFYLFGYKEKRSWYIFLIANILTQIFLNVAINNTIIPFLNFSHVVLIFYELTVMLTEFFIYKISIKEKRPVFIFVVVANITSWFLGGWLLLMLPL